jgi:uncharacterized protein
MKGRWEMKCPLSTSNRLKAIPGFCIAFFIFCTPLINTVAFHPEMSRNVSAGPIPPEVTQRYIVTADKVRLRCFLVRDTGERFAALYFHGNSSTIDQNLDDLLRMSTLGLNIFCVDYRGFGKSQGRPSEKGVYIDGLTAYRYMEDSLGFAQKNIFIIGISIGTAVAINTALGKNLAGIVLVAPLTSGKAYARTHGFGLLSLAAAKSFDNADKIKGIQCPLLVIHGSEDRLIPVSMGRKVFENAPIHKEFVEIKGGHHADLSSYDDEYWGSIDEFIKSAKNQHSHF